MFPKKTRVIYESKTNVHRLLVPRKILAGSDIRASKLDCLLSLTFRTLTDRVTSVVADVHSYAGFQRFDVLHSVCIRTFHSKMPNQRKRGLGERCSPSREIVKPVRARGTRLTRGQLTDLFPFHH